MAHLQKGADGHLLKNAAGHLVKTCATAADCGYCGTDYYQYEIVFSGLVFCTDCILDPVGRSIRVPSSPTYVNGTWTLTQASTTGGNRCLWWYRETGDFGTKYHYSAEVDCTGTVSSNSLYRFVISIRKNSATVWSIDMYYETSGGFYMVGMFNENHTVTSNDCEGFVVNHSYSSCPPERDHGYNERLTYDGSATITPV